MRRELRHDGRLRLVPPAFLLFLIVPFVAISSAAGVPGGEGAAYAPRGSASTGSDIDAKKQDKVTICHRTNSRTNPYNQIVVSESAAISGHAGHRGPIFGPGVDDWGDIIAPIRPGLPRGRNWPKGQAILKNGCEMPPDVGPLPRASIGEAECLGSNPSVAVTVTNSSRATASASFSITVDGTSVTTVGPLAPGESETVVLTGDPGSGLENLEDQTVTIGVESGGDVIASQVITVDCDLGSTPLVTLTASLSCAGNVAEGSFIVTDNGPDPVEVTTTADGAPIGISLAVAPGATETSSVDLSAYEDQTVTLTILVDGDPLASYTVTPDCVKPGVRPKVRVAGKVCPPPTATVTLANNGDPASQVTFVIRVNGRVVQKSAPLSGGDRTTIVADLTRYEDQTVVVAVRANGKLLGRRVIKVNCVQGRGGSDQAGDGALPAVGSPFGSGLVAMALGLVGTGALVLSVAGRAKPRQNP